MGVELYAFVNRTPSVAIRFICGVTFRAAGKAKASDRAWSNISRMRFGAIVAVVVAVSVEPVKTAKY